MTVTVHSVLLIIAFLAFLLATFGATTPRVNLVALGLALCVLSVLL